MEDTKSKTESAQSNSVSKLKSKTYRKSVRQCKITGPNAFVNILKDSLKTYGCGYNHNLHTENECTPET